MSGDPNEGRPTDTGPVTAETPPRESEPLPRPAPIAALPEHVFGVYFTGEGRKGYRCILCGFRVSESVFLLEIAENIYGCPAPLSSP
jgi:hypothetical protein